MPVCVALRNASASTVEPLRPRPGPSQSGCSQMRLAVPRPCAWLTASKAYSARSVPFSADQLIEYLRGPKWLISQVGWIGELGTERLRAGLLQFAIWCATRTFTLVRAIPNAGTMPIAATIRLADAIRVARRLNCRAQAGNDDVIASRLVACPLRRSKSTEELNEDLRGRQSRNRQAGETG